MFWEVAHAAHWNYVEAFIASNVMIDSTAAQSLATNSRVSAKNQHIDLKNHHVRELIENYVIHLTHLNTKNQPAVYSQRYCHLRHLVKWLT